MFCHMCGKQIRDEASFCPYCGTALKTSDVQDTRPKSSLPEEGEDVPIMRNQSLDPQKSRKGLIIGLCLAAVAIVLIAIFMIKGKGQPDNSKNQETHDLIFDSFSVDEQYFTSGEEYEIIFTAKLTEDVPEVTLYKEETKIGMMHDDGMEGDEVSGDGIYTYVLNDLLEAEETTETRFFAKADGVEDATISIYIFPVLSDNLAQEASSKYEEVEKSLSDAEKKLGDDEGYVDAEYIEQAFDEAEEILKSYIDSGDILFYERGEESIYAKFTSGIALVYYPKIRGVDAAGEDVSITVLTCQPYYKSMKNEAEDPAFLDLQDEKAQLLEDSFSNYTFQENLDDGEVTLEKIRSFGKDSVILWHGHGNVYNRTIWDVTVPILGTGESAGVFPLLSGDYITDKIVASGGKWWITPTYIDAYCGDMSGSFLYLAACKSGQYPQLAQAFLNKGAIAVVANTETISRYYNVMMMTGTIGHMMELNEETGNYYTLGEALKLTKEEYGNDDTEYSSDPKGATPIIYGADGYDYRFSQYDIDGSDSATDSDLTGVYVFDSVEPDYGDSDSLLGSTVTVEATSDGNYTAYVSEPGFSYTYDTFIERSDASIDLLNGLKSTGGVSQDGVRYDDADSVFYLVLHGDGIAVEHYGDGMAIFKKISNSNSENAYMDKLSEIKANADKTGDPPFGSNSVFYCFMDVDGDGFDEMLVESQATMNENSSYVTTSIYKQKGENIECIFSDPVGWESWQSSFCGFYPEESVIVLHFAHNSIDSYFCYQWNGEEFLESESIECAPNDDDAEAQAEGTLAGMGWGSKIDLLTGWKEYAEN